MEGEVVWNFRLLLCIRFYLDLKETFLVPSFKWNLILVSNLDKSDYLCSFRNNIFKLSFNSYIIGIASLMDNDNLYLLATVATYSKSLNVESYGTKRKFDNNNSGAL